MMSRLIMVVALLIASFAVANCHWKHKERKSTGNLMSQADTCPQGMKLVVDMSVRGLMTGNFGHRCEPWTPAIANLMNPMNPLNLMNPMKASNSAAAAAAVTSFKQPAEVFRQAGPVSDPSTARSWRSFHKSAGSSFRSAQPSMHSSKSDKPSFMSRHVSRARF